MRKFVLFAVLYIVFLTVGRCTSNDWQRWELIHPVSLERSLDSLLRVTGLEVDEWDMTYQFVDDSGDTVECYGKMVVNKDTLHTIVVKRMPGDNVIEYTKTKKQ